MRIYLIGYMGSGKSKVAEPLAKMFDYKNTDTDSLIESKTGKTIVSIFETEGEEYFRKIEKEILNDTAKIDNCVISTGGGTPCYNDNIDWMNENGLTVYLEANAGLLFHRLVASREGRPLLNKLNDVELMEQISGHLAVRIPFYRKSMITVPAASINLKTLAEKIKSFKKK